MTSSSTSRRNSDESMTKTSVAFDSLHGNDKKKTTVQKIFGVKQQDGRISEDENFARREILFDLERRFTTRRQTLLDASPAIRKCSSGRYSTARAESLNLSCFEKPKRHAVQNQSYRVFVGTWNVGGKAPNNGLSLDDFLQSEGPADIYVLGFQEIVPLNAGNVLVIEDSEPAAKWLALINQALNEPQLGDHHHLGHSSESHHSRLPNPKDSKSPSGLLFFQKQSPRAPAKICRADKAILKRCNCRPERKVCRETVVRNFTYAGGGVRFDCSGSDEDEAALPSPKKIDGGGYSLVSSKQMVGIFLSVWVRSELVQHVGHLRTSSLGRGIMGCFGNKGCIAISMSLHETSFCFVCSHLASGEKEGDEVRRNSDVAEIIKNIQFPKICKSRIHGAPQNILDHDRVIWFGDLNYRLSLSYEETRSLLEDNNWDALLEKDQLRTEREAGRVFQGWNEGRIHFAPTYKYTTNSDCYAGETEKSKKKRRTPAWCDRILWHGNGIEQLSYLRGESRFSDHRPVCGVFVAQTKLRHRVRCRKGYGSSVRSRVGQDECMPQRHSYYEC